MGVLSYLTIQDLSPTSADDLEVNKNGPQDFLNGAEAVLNNVRIIREMLLLGLISGFVDTGQWTASCLPAEDLTPFVIHCTINYVPYYALYRCSV